jgi:dTDP-4-amino-4,6-dideoxygalactose transaminase
MASIGLVQLKYLDEDNDYRNQIAKWYDELLDGVSGVKTISSNWFVEKSSRHLYQILVDEDKRDDIINHLYKNEIYPGVHYIDNTNYPMYEYANDSCPNVHRYSKQLITLPIHLGITYNDCKIVIKQLKEILK